MTTLHNLEQQKEDMLALVASWSEAQLTYRPNVEEWSAAEMFDHIIKVESGILAAAQLGLDAPHPISLIDRGRTAFLARIFRSDRRVKVPDSARHILPDHEPSFAEVTTRWSKCREDLAQFISGFPDSQRDQGIFQHPVGGWMNLAEVLNFFSVHMVHHGFQLDRLAGSSRQKESH